MACNINMNNVKKRIYGFAVMDDIEFLGCDETKKEPLWIVAENLIRKVPNETEFTRINISESRYASGMSKCEITTVLAENGLIFWHLNFTNDAKTEECKIMAHLEKD